MVTFEPRASMPRFYALDVALTGSDALGAALSPIVDLSGHGAKACRADLERVPAVLSQPSALSRTEAITYYSDNACKILLASGAIYIDQSVRYVQIFENGVLFTNGRPGGEACIDSGTSIGCSDGNRSRCEW